MLLWRGGIASQALSRADLPSSSCRPSMQFPILSGVTMLVEPSAVQKGLASTSFVRAMEVSRK